MSAFARWLRRSVTVIKRIAGMPDYERYVAHLRAEHAGCPIPSEREFYSTYLKGRYEGGGSRCC